MIPIAIKVAPRDIVRLQALCEGYDGLGVPETLDARRGLLRWSVPASCEALARAALSAASSRMALRVEPQCSDDEGRLRPSIVAGREDSERPVPARADSETLEPGVAPDTTWAPAGCGERVD